MNAEARKLIAERLQADATLVAMLGNNKNWLKGGTLDKKWSIMPYDKVTERMAMPIVTVQSGVNNQAGYKLVEDFFYLRCYNSVDKTYVTIDDVLLRVKVLLHRHRFDFTGSTSIETLYESTGPELRDDGYKLNFREARIRLLRVE